MADGTISMMDGLGFKAVDSNKLRRKQKITVESDTPLISTQIHSILPGNSSPSTSLGFGAYSPKSIKSSSPAWKMQQVLFEESLILEAEERAALVHGNTHQFSHQSSEVVTLSNPKILYNERGDPYVEGDPNLGYSPRSLQPRYASNFPAVVNHGSTLSIGFQSKPGSPSAVNPVMGPIPLRPLLPATSNRRQSNNTIDPRQPHPIPNKFKPKSWASILQSQGPSMDMKLEYFPDLQRGKEAQVEIDLELTEVGKWNRYLIGHFLDGKMAYPLIVSTARNQWKDQFVAVKPDVAGFYLFEFKNEQAKMQILEGSPYIFSQKYLVLKDRHRMMKPAQDQPTRFPAWVKLHDLPFELLNQECLNRVASTIGKPLHVDQATAKSARQPGLLNIISTKARICIEISAEQDLFFFVDKPA